jgi:acetyl-CoA synthetase
MSSFLAASPPDVYPPILSGIDSKHDEVERWNSYRAEYQKSIEDPTKFWTEMSEKYLSWFSPFDRVLEGSFVDGDVKYFANGKINACYNCIDRHLPERENQTAIIWEGDEIGTNKHVTYRELSQEVCRIANVMKMNGVKKGDVVTIYMPMVPEVAMTMLACARIGAVHSIVFAGFSADSLRDRILDCNSKFVFVADEGKRGGKTLALRHIAEAAVVQCPGVSHLFLFKTTGDDVPVVAHPTKVWNEVWMQDWMPRARPVCPCEWMDAEDDIFILYTSGSTGKPKGVAHTTGGYLLYAAMTLQKSFDYKVAFSRFDKLYGAICLCITFLPTHVV